MRRSPPYLQLVDEDGDGVELVVGVGRICHDELNGRGAYLFNAQASTGMGWELAGGDRVEVGGRVEAVMQSIDGVKQLSS